ncbi:MAG: hypothetical protein ACK4F4_00945 [Hylemonella sp.]|uniref:hypothetical protein n=1 Tax=Hylemonella sp. TaxID=2066020 RepID=UPI00391ADA78
MKFFKPKPVAPARPISQSTRPASRPSPAAGLPPTPPPLPEVTEGNLESDWAMWEDSVAFQDSQMPSAFNELEAVKTRDDPPKKKDGTPDPFSTVRKRGS